MPIHVLSAYSVSSALLSSSQPLRNTSSSLMPQQRELKFSYCHPCLQFEVIMWALDLAFTQNYILGAFCHYGYELFSVEKDIKYILKNYVKISGITGQLFFSRAHQIWSNIITHFSVTIRTKSWGSLHLLYHHIPIKTKASGAGVDETLELNLYFWSDLQGIFFSIKAKKEYRPQWSTSHKKKCLSVPRMNPGCVV